jgi:hypothetical protein
MVKNSILIFLIIITIACNKNRVSDTEVLDEDFIPTTTPFNISNLQDGNICFYRNNFVKLLAQNFENASINWYKIENGTKTFMGSEKNLTISTKGIFECKIFSEKIDTLILLNIKYCQTKIEFPDFFKPNSSNFPLWRPIGYGVQQWFLNISDKKKKTVYESASFENTNWNGKIENTPAPAGTYTYYLTGTYRSGIIFEFNGTFELVR